MKHYVIKDFKFVNKRLLSALFVFSVSSASVQAADNLSLKERVEKLEKEVERSNEIKHGPSPDFKDPDGNFTFGFRGRLQLDAAAFDAGSGGYDFNSGTQVRRARLGLEGTIYKDWGWRVEADFASGNSAALQDAYVQYKGFKDVKLTFGQALTPTNLETLTSSRFTTFIERGSVINAFDIFRVMGIQAKHANNNWSLAGGVFGGSATTNAQNNNAAGQGNDEGYSIHGRGTISPINDGNKVLHLGVAGFYRTNLADDQIRFRDRPEIRVDNTRLVDTTNITNVEDYNFLGLEAAGVYGPFSVQGQYGTVEVSRDAGLQDVDFDGYYIYGSYFLTGESRPYTKGTFSRVKPKRNFTLGGGPGAWEIAARYSELDLNDGAINGGQMNNYTVGLNWYPNKYSRLMLNWVSFDAENSPAAVVGSDVDGDVYAARLEVNW